MNSPWHTMDVGSLYGIMHAANHINKPAGNQVGIYVISFPSCFHMPRRTQDRICPRYPLALHQVNMSPRFILLFLYYSAYIQGIYRDLNHKMLILQK